MSEQLSPIGMGATSASGNAVPHRSSQTELAVMALRGNVERLNVVLGVLETKLAPILRGKNLAQHGGIGANDDRIEKKDPEDKVGLARVIHEQSDYIAAMAAEMDRMLNRIEV